MSDLALIFADEACAESLSDARLLAAMARFEGALALASGRAGGVPPADAETIARVCERAKFDIAALARAARRAGALAIPLVRNLTEQVAAVSTEAARYVHFGATSQDVTDTGVALCLRDALARVDAIALRLGDAASVIARTHAHTPTVARTLLQPALPIPFGFKAAVWLSLTTRALAGLRAEAQAACRLQFGGAGGTLSAFGEQGDAVANELARELGLPRAAITWHSGRDTFARLGAALAILAGAAGKIARDVTLLMQPEIGEALEPIVADRGGSSSMPHKRNPAGCLLALEAAQRAPALAATLLAQLASEHERGIGHWQNQWFTLRELVSAAASGAVAMAEVLEGLQLDADAMRVNLERSRGLVYSEAVSLRLARTLGKAAAHALTEQLCEIAVHNGATLQQTLAAHPQAAAAVGVENIDALFVPENCFGSAPAMIERALADWQAMTQAVTQALMQPVTQAVRTAGGEANH